MSLNCTDGRCVPICEFPYRFDNATDGCASSAHLLGDAFTAYNLGYTWAAALLLFGFLRSWLFNLREHNWHFASLPSVLIPLLCTIAQVLVMIEATNLFSLRWSTRIWASLGCGLFFPCAFSALLVYFNGARPRPHTLRGMRQRFGGLFHALPWCLGLGLSIPNATDSVLEGVSHIHMVPFGIVLAADMAFVAWTLRAAQENRHVRRRFIGLVCLLGLIAAYVMVRGMSILLGNDGQAPRVTPVTFPFDKLPVPVVKVIGSTLALFHYGWPRRDTPTCRKSQYVDPLTLIAAHIAVLSGLLS
jgi:hypothetical protein